MSGIGFMLIGMMITPEKTDCGTRSVSELSAQHRPARIEAASCTANQRSVRSFVKPTVITLTALAAIGWTSLAGALQPVELMRGFVRTQLVLSGTVNCIHIDAFVAQTRSQRAQGLMHVQSMEAHEGMLFLYADPTVISMWMKNTYIPLDMVFADLDGRVVHLHRDAIPHDTTVISSVEPSSLVLELNAGSIDGFGIRTGDQVSLFDNLY